MNYSLANPIITTPSFEENIKANTSEGDALTVQELTVFDNVDPTNVVNPRGVSYPLTPFVDASNGVASFLRRPVLLSTINWTGATSAVTYIQPWAQLLANPAYNDKIVNFYGLRADVKLKFILNGTPFHYGRMVAWYLPGTGPSGTNCTTRPSYINRIINHVTGGGVYGLQHVILDPTLSEPAEMTLPFECQSDFSHFQVGAPNMINSVTNLGLVGITPDVPLQSASQAVPEAVTIQVYGWFENIIFANPTPYSYSAFAATLPADSSKEEEGPLEGAIFDVQGGEAISAGPVTRVATAVAGAAAILKRIPFIKPFAMATEIGANAVAGIATIFGFSLPLTFERGEVVKQHLAANWSFLSGKDTSVKLTLDPLQEITVDPKAIGFADPRDQMSYQFLYKIPTLMRRLDWSVGTSEGTNLGTFIVSPAATPISPVSSYPAVAYPSPLNALAHGHTYWRGTLRYRIEVICSAYHKGRLQVRYIPQVGTSTINTTTYPGFGAPTAQTMIMDLSTDHKKEFTVGWSQAALTKQSAPMFASTDPNGAAVFWAANGYFTVEILTKLTAPATVASVKVLVFMEGTEDLEFIEPTNIYFSQVDVQSGKAEVLSTGGEITNVHFGGPAKIPEGFTKVIQGEKAVSLRSLLKRFMPIGRFSNAVGAGPLKEQLSEVRLYLDPKVGSTFYSDVFFSTTYRNYPDFWRLSYMGVKGGRRYKVVLTPGSSSTTALEPKRTMVYRTKATPGAASYSIPYTDVMQRSNCGHFAFNNQNEVIEFELPDYGTGRFRYNNAAVNWGSYSSTTALDGAAVATLCTYNAATAGQVVTEVFTALSDDASFLNFVACPPLTIPAAFTGSLTIV